MPPISIKPKLDPVIPEHKLQERKHWNYQRIQAAKKAPAITVPDEWINPLAIQYIRKMRKDQGDIGQCCGARSYGDELLDQFLLLKDYPTEEDYAAIERGCFVREAGWSCTLRFDKLPRGGKARSMRFAYITGREREWPRPEDRPPEGGTVEGTVIAACKDGSISEELCTTPKTFVCAPDFYTQEINPATGLRWTEAEIREEARKHCWEGYSISGNSINEIADALYTSFTNGSGGCGFVGVNIMADYQNLQAVTVAGYTIHIFPGKSGESIGGHFQTIVGFSKSKGILVTLSSWEYQEAVWPFLNGWDAAYHRANAGPVFIPLDTQETAIGKATYSTTLISANVPCQFTVNGQLYMEAPKVSLQDRLVAKIIATPIAPDAVELTPTVMVNGTTALLWGDGSFIFAPDKNMEVPDPDGKPVINVSFTFTAKPEPTPTPPGGKSVLDILIGILHWLLSLLPFYKPTGEQRQAIQEALDSISKALEE